MVVNHMNGVKTDNRLSNLECVTVGENVRHAFQVLGRRRGGGEKLDEKAVLVMRHAVARKIGTLRRLAERYGVTETCVSSVVTGRTWAHVGGPITPSRQVKQTGAQVAARIPDDVVAQVVARYRRGEKVLALAREFDVNKRTVYNWIEGRTRARRAG